MRHIWCSSEVASGKVVKYSKVRASRSSRSVKSSRSEKSSRYNRKRASGARHTQCVRHIGCSSEAASGNVVEYHIGEFHTVTSSMEIVSHTFEGGWGVQKSSTKKIPKSTPFHFDKASNLNKCNCPHLSK